MLVQVSVKTQKIILVNRVKQLPDQDLYCGICYKKETAPERPQVMTDTTVIMGSGDTDVKDTCPVCGGKVGGRPCPVTQLSSLFTSRCLRQRR